MDVKIKYATEFGISETILEINELKNWINRYNFKIYCIEEQGLSYSEEEFKEMVYHMVGGLAQANNMTFNGAILDELFNKFKNK